MRWGRRPIRLAALSALVLTAGCSRSPAMDLTPVATVKDLMQSIVDPSADIVWMSVMTVHAESGTSEVVPQTDEDWMRVRYAALALSEAANLLIVPGRHVARPGEVSETPGVELEPVEMESLIARDPVAWAARARALQTAAQAVVHAVDERNPDKVFELGEGIEMACENCHRQYWYPNERIPPLPESFRGE